MEKSEKLIQETVTVSNIFEAVSQTIDKVGLEKMAPVEPSRLQEIISKEIVSQARS